MTRLAGQLNADAAGEWRDIPLRQCVRLLMPYLSPYRWHLLAVLLATVIVSSSPVFALLVVEQILHVLINEDPTRLNGIVLLAVSVCTLIALIVYAQVYLSACVGYRVAAVMRQDALRHLLASTGAVCAETWSDCANTSNDDIIYGVGGAALGTGLSALLWGATEVRTRGTRRSELLLEIQELESRLPSAEALGVSVGVFAAGRPGLSLHVEF